MPALLGTAYFPPIEYFAAMAEEFVLPPLQQSHFQPVPSVVWLEARENFQKQSYRNRCHICSSGGRESLSFPVVHKNGTHQLPITEIEVDYSTPWVMQHKRAIVSAYGTSAYFEYYRDELFGILDSRPAHLFELNLSIIGFFLEKTGIRADLKLTADYVRPASRPGTDASSVILEGREMTDYREVIHPKRPNAIMERLGLQKPYFQVFASKYGFIPNLSIMDLLFNEGPDSILYLKRR